MPSTFPVARFARPVRRARRVARALRAPSARKWLWLCSLGLVASMRLGLWTLPLRTLQVLVARLGQGRYSAPLPMQNASSQSASEREKVLEVSGVSSSVVHQERELNWAITRAARFVPGASCLTQALALQVLLARRGLGSRLCIGVRKGAAAGFEAHAWVERGGRVLIGGEGNTGDRGSWTPLTAWDFSVRPGLGKPSSEEGGERA